MQKYNISPENLVFHVITANQTVNYTKSKKFIFFWDLDTSE